MKKHGLFLEILETKVLLAPIVAIIDSGVDLNHAALQQYIWTNPRELPNNIDDDNNGYVDDIHGWNFANGNNVVQDGYGHGTHVAGIVSSYGPVSLMPLKFQNDSGLGYTGAAASAINYAVMMKKTFGYDIVAINASWGGSTSYSLTLEKAIRSASEANIVFVSAAGNNSSDNDLAPRYPSSFDIPNIIAVAACENDNATMAAFSNYGKNSVDLAAKGVSVYSTLPNNNYGYMSGTSMATPQVAGAVAAISNKYGHLSVSDIKSKIFGSVEKNVGLADKVFTGGSLNINGALSSGPIVIISPVAPQPVKDPVVVKSWSERVVGQTDECSTARVRGWALDTDNMSDKIRVRIVINNQTTMTTDADRYYSKISSYGDKCHGFNIRLGPRFFNRGWNDVKVYAENKETGELKIISTHRVMR